VRQTVCRRKSAHFPAGVRKQAILCTNPERSGAVFENAPDLGGIDALGAVK
jgi:hypothetical protein